MSHPVRHHSTYSPHIINIKRNLWLFCSHISVTNKRRLPRFLCLTWLNFSWFFLGPSVIPLILSMLAVHTLEGVSSKAWPHHAKIGHCHLPPMVTMPVRSSVIGNCFTSHTPQHARQRSATEGRGCTHCNFLSTGTALRQCWLVDRPSNRKTGRCQRFDAFLL